MQLCYCDYCGRKIELEVEKMSIKLNTFLSGSVIGLNLRAINIFNL